MSTIDWSMWSAIAEIFSAIAILITLVYLAAQTRNSAVQTEQNTAALLAANRQAALGTELQWLYLSLDRPEEVWSIWGIPMMEDTSHEHDPKAFSNAITMATGLLRMRETQWLNYEAGVLDSAVWESYRDTFVLVLQQSEFFRAVWDFYASKTMTQGFQEEINSRLSN